MGKSTFWFNIFAGLLWLCPTAWYVVVVVMATIDPAYWLPQLVSLDVLGSLVPALFYWFTRPVRRAMSGVNKAPRGSSAIWWVFFSGIVLALFHTALYIAISLGVVFENTLVVLPYIVGCSLAAIWALNHLSSYKYVDMVVTATPQRHNLPPE